MYYSQKKKSLYFYKGSDGHTPESPFDYFSAKCRCCPWQLLQVPKCNRFLQHKSFDNVHLILRFFPANSSSSERYQNWTGKQFSMVGVGASFSDFGLCNSDEEQNHSHNHSLQDIHDNHDHNQGRDHGHRNNNHDQDQKWSAWSLNHRTLVDPALNANGWRSLYESLMNSITQQMSNLSVSTHGISKIVDDYKAIVFQKFERLKDCGKKTVDRERRCLHHAVSPLDYDPKSHRSDFSNLEDIQPPVNIHEHILPIT